MDSPPTLVLVTGAFHVAEHIALLKSESEKAGHACISCGLKTGNASTQTLCDDVEFLQKEILHPLIQERCKDVVLYLHSYAGFPGSAAIEGLAKKERTDKDMKDGIIGLIYQSALLPIEGASVLDMVGGVYPDWQVSDVDAGLNMVVDPINSFYQDVSVFVAKEASEAVRGQSLLSIRAKSGPVFYTIKHYDGRRLYVRTV